MPEARTVNTKLEVVTLPVCEHGVAGDDGVEPGLALVEAEAVLAESEIFFNRPAQPCRPDQPGLGQQLTFGYEAVVKGQLAGLEVAANEQVMAREAVASQAQAYQRSPLEPLRRSGPPSTACALAAP